MKRKIWILALAAIVAGGTIGINSMSVHQASAGWREKDILDNAVLSENELDKNAWFIDDGISLENKKIVFAKNTFEDAKLLYRTQVFADAEKSNYVIKATLGINQMTGEKRFGIGFGFDRSRYVVGDENTGYFYVEKGENGYVAGLCSYDSDEKKTEYIQTPVALEGSEWDIELTVSYPNNVQAKIDGTTVYDDEVTMQEVSGYFGFLETGYTTDTQYSEGYISALTVDNDYYDTPENVNIYDDFEDGSINTAVWYMYNDGPYMKGMAETDGMLRFINSNGSTLTTRYQYSNFEMRLDVPYIKRTAEFNSDGSLRSPACCWFGFFCGLELDDYTSIGHTDRILLNYYGYFLSFRGNLDAKGVPTGGTSVLFGPTTGRTTYALPAKYDLWDVENDGKILNVIFTCNDGVYSLSIKWADETEYYKVFTVEYALQTGYIVLCGYGAGDLNSVNKGNFAYDNVKITNRDYKGQVISGLAPESEALLKETEDYGYADTKLPAQLLQDGADFDATEGASGCSGVVDPASLAVSAATLGAVLTTIKRRNRK